MHPIFFTIQEFSLFGRAVGPLPIYMYGVMLSIAFLLAIALTCYEARKVNLSVDIVLDCAIYVIVGAIIMSRVGYVVTNWGDYSGDATSALKIYEGGLSFHGGVIGGAMAVIAFCLIKKIRIFHFGDAAMPGLALGLAIGRIGCFMNACCYGRPTDVSWGVVFPALQDGIRRHPSQLYDMVFNLSIMLLLMFPLKRFKRKDGDLFAFWLILSGVTRYIMEHFRRGETAIVFWLDFTMGQWMCMAMIVGGLFLFALKGKGSEPQDAS